LGVWLETVPCAGGNALSRHDISASCNPADPYPHVFCLPLPLQALQRGLPRPTNTDLLPAPRPASEAPKLSLRERAEDMLVREMRAILEHDGAKYPIIAPGKDSKEAKKAAKRAASAYVPPIDQFQLKELESAASLLQNEVRAEGLLGGLVVPWQHCRR
jgi:hypothetical protein